jgi:SAM-dependent methyltransferase
MTNETPQPGERERQRELQREYALRFENQKAYRDAVWKILTAEFFQLLIGPQPTLLDLGSGWGEFINNIVAKQKYAMNLNPEARERVAADVKFFEQDCSKDWPLPDGTLDCVFTSNFFEHLPGKDALRSTLLQVHRCLRHDGTLICMGPNIRLLPGAYWDFWDHSLPLTEHSLAEALELFGFHIEQKIGRFLPYKMAGTRPVPMAFVRCYLKLPLAWRLFGKQFLVIGRKRGTDRHD